MCNFERKIDLPPARNNQSARHKQTAGAKAGRRIA